MDDLDERSWELYHATQAVIEKLHQTLDCRFIFLAGTYGSVQFVAGALGADSMEYEVWVAHSQPIQEAFQSAAYEPGNGCVWQSLDFGFLHVTRLNEGRLLVVGLKTAQLSKGKFIQESAVILKDLLEQDLQLIIEGRKATERNSNSGSAGGSQSSPASAGFWISKQPT